MRSGALLATLVCLVSSYASGNDAEPGGNVTDVLAIPYMEVVYRIQ